MKNNTTNILQWDDKVQAFLRKLQLWKTGISGGDQEMFPVFENVLRKGNFHEIPSSVKTCIINHMNKRKEHFEEYFSNILITWHG